MNTDDRQQHIDTLADEIAHVMVGSGWYANSIGMEAAREAIGELFDSTDPRVHDALTAALHANADRARLLAAHADAGWLDARFGVLSFANRQVVPVDSEGAADHASKRLGGAKMRRLVTPWEPTP